MEIGHRQGLDQMIGSIDDGTVVGQRIHRFGVSLQVEITLAFDLKVFLFKTTKWGFPIPNKISHGLPLTIVSKGMSHSRG